MIKVTWNEIISKSTCLSVHFTCPHQAEGFVDPRYICTFPIYKGLSERVLTHWGRVTYICKLTINGSDNGLSPGRHQAIIWTNAGILLIRTLGTNFSEILREIYTFSFKKMHLKMSYGKCRPSCLSVNVLKHLWFHLFTILLWRFHINACGQSKVVNYSHILSQCFIWPQWTPIIFQYR